MSASDHLSPVQFGERYGEGLHHIPVEHVWGIRDEEAVDHPNTWPDVSKGVHTPLEAWVLGGHASLGDGHHRLHAARAAKLSTVPVEVHHI